MGKGHYWWVWGMVLYALVGHIDIGVALMDDEKSMNSSHNYDYGDALAKAILFFEGQRSGKLPSTQRVNWRADSALSDGNLENVNLVGGYYDAGDNVKFGWPMAFTVSLLSWTAIEYESEISSVKQMEYLRSAIRWGSDFILRSHSSPTILFTQLFDFADKYRGSYSGSCPFYCSYSGYQDELLWAASWLYKASGESKYLNYIRNNQGWSQAVSEFSWDNKFVGAQTLLTQEFYEGKKDLGKFKNDAESFICAVMPGSSSLQIRTTPGGLLYIRDNSNLQYATSSTMLLFIFSNILRTNHINGIQCGSTHFTPSQIRAFAKTQVDYILGSNPMKMSYMVGFGSKYPKHLHHRGSSIPSIKVHPGKVGCNDGHSDYYSSTNPNPNVHVGAIVGGPDANDHFNDVRSDYSHSEPTTYINAAFLPSLAALIS
ncbi:Endoglucanase [Senna tora]|uniref:Endoglucanase n=1 Tax=Senna tora TaxID=362788 RepID=A0A834TXL8_9FABA|nr:Endoglucanase [Senna tora]